MLNGHAGVNCSRCAEGEQSINGRIANSKIDKPFREETSGRTDGLLFRKRFSLATDVAK